MIQKPPTNQELRRPGDQGWYQKRLLRVTRHGSRVADVAPLPERFRFSTLSIRDRLRLPLFCGRMSLYQTSPPAQVASSGSTPGNQLACRDVAMASSVALAKCSACGQVQADYERATIVRMQAEADLLAAVHARDSVAIRATTRTLRDALIAWGNAQAALRQHEKAHDLGNAAASVRDQPCHGNSTAPTRFSPKL